MFVTNLPKGSRTLCRAIIDALWDEPADERQVLATCLFDAGCRAAGWTAADIVVHLRKMQKAGSVDRRYGFYLLTARGRREGHHPHT